MSTEGFKQVDAVILGQAYRLSCPPDGEARLAQAVALVDREMGTIRDAGRIKARERIAVLAALNLAWSHLDLLHAGDSASPSVTAAEPPSDARVEALIERIDAVLNEDGHLL